MKNTRRHLPTLLMVALCVLSGWWIARSSNGSQVKRPSPAPAEAVRPVSPLPRRAGPVIHRDEFRDGTTVEIFASKSPNEVILRFPSDQTYGDFLSALPNSEIQLVDQLDRLRAVRLGYDEWEDLAVLLEGENIVAYDSLPALPAPTPTDGPRPGASSGT